MGQKKATAESDIARLKTKVMERRKSSAKTDSDPALRSLHKNLKRAQRKQRSLASRKSQGSRKKSEAKPATAS
jgi:hypothetical protein